MSPYRFLAVACGEFSLGDERYSVPVGGNLSANESVVFYKPLCKGAGVSLTTLLLGKTLS